MFHRDAFALTMAPLVSPEQKARELLHRLEHPRALSMTAGDVVELANLIVQRDYHVRRVDELKQLLTNIRELAKLGCDPHLGSGPLGPYGTLEAIISDIDDELQTDDDD